MYKNLVDWDEFSYVLSKLKKGEITTKTLSQRIYRSEDVSKILAYKLAQFVYKMEIDDED